MKWLKCLLPHATLIIALILLTLFVIDRVNRAMMFLATDLTKWLLAVFAVLVIVQSVMAIVKAHQK